MSNPYYIYKKKDLSGLSRNAHLGRKPTGPLGMVLLHAALITGPSDMGFIACCTGPSDMGFIACCTEHWAY